MMRGKKELAAKGISKKGLTARALQLNADVPSKWFLHGAEPSSDIDKRPEMTLDMLVCTPLPACSDPGWTSHTAVGVRWLSEGP